MLSSPVRCGQTKVDALASANAYLLASHSEGHPWSVLEAMSAGLPVVATRTGAVPDTVADGDTGYLLTIGDVEGMADALVRILRDETLQQHLGRNAVHDPHAVHPRAQPHAVSWRVALISEIEEQVSDDGQRRAH